MSFQKIKAIVFDVDGVLVNSTNEQGQFLWCKVGSGFL